MKMNGRTHRGNHPAAISVAEFRAVQAQLAGRPQTHERATEIFFPYRGLVTCGQCGATVTPERKKNRHGSRYIYYRCARKERPHRYCPQPAIEERVLESQLQAFLEKLALPNTVLKFAMDKLAELEKESDVATEEAVNRIEQEIARLQRKDDRLKELCLDDRISPDEFTAEREQLANERYGMEEQLAKLRQNGATFEPFSGQLFSLNKDMSLFDEAIGEEKREITKTACSNLTLMDGKLLVIAKKPYSYFQNVESIPTLLAVWDDIRTNLIHETAYASSVVDARLRS